MLLISSTLAFRSVGLVLLADLIHRDAIGEGPSDEWVAGAMAAQALVSQAMWLYLVAVFGLYAVAVLGIWSSTFGGSPRT